MTSYTSGTTKVPSSQPIISLCGSILDTLKIPITLIVSAVAIEYTIQNWCMAIIQK